MFLHQLYNIRASLFISKSLILIKQQYIYIYIYFNHKQNNLSHLIPHTTHHKPYYRVRIPSLPWIEGCSTIFRSNSVFLFSFFSATSTFSFLSSNSFHVLPLTIILLTASSFLFFLTIIK